MHLSTPAGPLGNAAQHSGMAHHADNLSAAGGNCSGGAYCGNRNVGLVAGGGNGAGGTSSPACTVLRLPIAFGRHGPLLPAAVGSLVASSMDANVRLFASQNCVG